MDLDKGSSKNIQDIIVTLKERLYMGKSGKIRTISGFLDKNRKIRTVLKNQESKHAARPVLVYFTI
jgi:hypothetical protein